MPGTLPEIPGTLPAEPGTLLFSPGTLPGVPGTLPAAPGTLLFPPGTLPSVLGTLPAGPGTLPATPGTFPADLGREAEVRSSDEQFYKHAWFYLMRHTVPRLQCHELLVVPASLGTKKKRLAFYDMVRDVMKQVGRITYRTACWDASSDACLQVADYCGWAIQRRWESSDPAPHARISAKILSEFDLFARGMKTYY